MNSIGFTKTETNDKTTFTTVKTKPTTLDYITYLVWLFLLTLVVAYLITSEVDTAYTITAVISTIVLAVFLLKIVHERKSIQEIIVSDDMLIIKKAGMFKPKEFSFRKAEIKKIHLKVIGIPMSFIEQPHFYLFFRSFFTFFTLKIPAIDAGQEYEDTLFFENIPKRSRIQIVEALNSIITQ